MGNILTKLRRLPKRTSALTAVIATAIIVPAALFAYGPDRPTFTIENPADHITFNSITNNPNIGGDERDFVGIREKGTTGTWKNNVTVEKGKEYTVRAYVHNNAASNLNLVAQNVRATFSVPTTTGKSVQVQGSISADNASPKAVWDEAAFNSTEDFNVAYVAGSAKFSNNVFTGDGVSLPDSIVTSAGAQLGYDKLDGKIPGCFKYDGYVYFTVKPQFAPTNEFETQKQVRKEGQTTWSKNVDANAGDSVEYQLTYKNTGGTVQDNVVMKDTLPAGVIYTPGSTYVKNGANPTPIKVSDNLTTTAGINIGKYQPGATAYVKFSAKVASNDKLPVCGPNTLTNKVRTSVDGGYKEDTADVTVPKECQPTNMQVCDLTTKKIVTIKESEFDSNKYSKNLADCAIPGKINVCDLKTKTVVSIKESQFDSSKYSKNLADCKTDYCQVPGKEHLPKDSSECIEDTVTELPETGISTGAIAFSGLGLLTAGLAYAFTSSRIRKLFIG